MQALKLSLAIFSFVFISELACAQHEVASPPPATSKWILLLYWVSQDQPILNHMVFNSRKECEKHIQAMQEVFLTMNNDQYVMQCQSENDVQPSGQE